MIRIVAVGKKHEDWVVLGLERYQKRLKGAHIVKWELIPHSSREGLQARENESEALLSRLGSNDFVILLDEIGKELDSPALSALFERQFAHSASIVCVIGGAYGVTTALHERANFVWSLSPLVFPHQLVRLMLIEQIYRSQEIAAGGKYHHY